MVDLRVRAEASGREEDSNSLLLEIRTSCSVFKVFSIRQWTRNSVLKRLSDVFIFLFPKSRTSFDCRFCWAEEFLPQTCSPYPRNQYLVTCWRLSLKKRNLYLKMSRIVQLPNYWFSSLNITSFIFLNACIYLHAKNPSCRD